MATGLYKYVKQRFYFLLFKDGASPHRKKKVLDYLQSSFGTRTLALGSDGWGGMEWCPNSPDLAPLDFCIWGVMKHHVFSHPMPENRNQLVDKINLVWDQDITEDLIKKASQGLLNRCQKVINVNGRHQIDE